jgi:FKBP-type peptidyl-prolyl cis-trans isomerase FkpA
MNKAIPYVIGAALMAGALVPLYYVKDASPDAKKGNHHIAADKASDIQKISYALGYQVSAQTPPELDTQQFVQGFEDGHAKQKPHFTEEQISAALAAYQQAQQQKQLCHASPMSMISADTR